MKRGQTQFTLMILLSGLALSVTGCMGTSPLSVFFSPNPNFGTPAASPTVTAAATPVPSMYPPASQIPYNITVLPDPLMTNQYAITQDQVEIQRAGRIASRLDEALAEAQAHIHAGESRLQDKSLLEAVREFELARQLVEQQVDPSLQYVQEYPKVTGGVSILSEQEIQSVYRRRTSILDSINRAYNVNTLFEDFQQQQRVDALRAERKTTLRPVVLNEIKGKDKDPTNRCYPESLTAPDDVELLLPWDEAGSYIRRFQQHAQVFQAYLRRADQYFPTVRALLSAQGVPDDLAYLPLIESGYQPAVEDPSGRAGLWQLSRSIAQKYGLVVTSGRDERKDLEASTRAFARYITYLRDRFDSWELAILAYEMGEDRLQRVIHQTGYYNLQAVRDQLGMSSQEGAFLAKFAAAILLAHNSRDCGLNIDLPNISGESAIAPSRQPKIAVMNEPPSAILYIQP